MRTRHCRRRCAGDEPTAKALSDLKMWLRARRAHPHAAAPRQEQALRAARARGRVHRQGQGAQALRVRRQGQPGRHAQARADGGCTQLPRQPVRRPHPQRRSSSRPPTCCRTWRASPSRSSCDLGFRGVDADNPGVEIIHRGKFKTPERRSRSAGSSGARPSSRPSGTSRPTTAWIGAGCRGRWAMRCTR